MKGVRLLIGTRKGADFILDTLVLALLHHRHKGVDAI